MNVCFQAWPAVTPLFEKGGLGGMFEPGQSPSIPLYERGRGDLSLVPAHKAGKGLSAYFGSVS